MGLGVAGHQDETTLSHRVFCFRCLAVDAFQI